MSSVKSFKESIDKGYTFKKDFIVLGGAMFNQEPVQNTLVKVPLKTINRHGLIAGATGTGKTKTLQVFAEQLSEKGIPSVLMDLKGDLSGLAQPGASNDHIVWRHGAIGIPYHANALPVELMSLSSEKGVKLRATISEFGPILLSKILGLNNTQRGIMSMLFKYCDDHKLPLLDLKDLKKTLQYFAGEGKKEVEKEYGRISGASISTILRKIIELEQEGAEQFFGEKSFDVEDFIKTKKGKGVLSIIRLTDIQSKPKMFSTFMLSLLAEIYATLPESGDNDTPKLCMFIDEAHLVFKEASDDLLDQLEAIIKLIRSKGVGIYFCTQNPTDIPEAVLGQLGLKIQHALRAFTAKDRKAIKQTSENYPITEFYDTDTLITSLGIGEAFVTVLNEKGIPTPLVATLLRAPITRMNILTDKEIDEIVSNSNLVEKYNKEIDKKSAFEILTDKIEKAQKKTHQEKLKKEAQKARRTVGNRRSRSTTRTTTRRRSKSSSSTLEKISKNTLVRQVGRTVFRELARGLLGILGVKR